MAEKSTRSVEEIEREIARKRMDLVDHMAALQSSVHNKLDWKRPIRRNPIPIVAAAFGLGFLIGWR